MVKWFSGTVAMKKKNLQQMVIGVIGKTGYLEAKNASGPLYYLQELTQNGLKT